MFEFLIVPLAGHLQVPIDMCEKICVTVSYWESLNMFKQQFELERKIDQIRLLGPHLENLGDAR